MWKIQTFFPGKKCENLFFFTKNFPQYLPLDTWIAVSANLLPKVCHQETGKDLKKKYQKDELISKSTSGHVECSFENPSRNFSPKGVDFLAQTPRSVLNYIGFKKTTFPQTFLWTRKLHFSETCHFFFITQKSVTLKYEEGFYIFFFELDFLSSRFLLDIWYAFLRVLLISFSQETEIQWQNNTSQKWYSPSYGFSRQVEGSFDKPKAQNVLVKRLEIVWKKNILLQSYISFKRFF